MRRRDFLGLVGGGIASGRPSAMYAQQPAKTPHIAIVDPVTPVSELTAGSYRGYRVFFDELSRGG
jgi:hypothetical protein